jgi:hypothetical protein
LGVDTEAMQADGKVDIGDSMPPVTDAILTIGHPMPGTRPIPTLKSNGIVIGCRHSPKSPRVKYFTCIFTAIFEQTF